MSNSSVENSEEINFNDDNNIDSSEIKSLIETTLEEDNNVSNDINEQEDLENENSTQIYNDKIQEDKDNKDNKDIKDNINDTINMNSENSTELETSLNNIEDDENSDHTNVLQNKITLKDLPTVADIRDSLETVPNDDDDEEKPTNVLENKITLKDLPVVANIRDSLETVPNDDDEEKPTNVLENKMGIKNGSVGKLKNIWQNRINQEKEEEEKIIRRPSITKTNKTSFLKKYYNIDN